MIYVETLTESYIRQRHGWAVAEQFMDTFEGQSFDEQNSVALNHIGECVADIINADILNEPAKDELQTYLDSLKDYIVGKGR